MAVSGTTFTIPQGISSNTITLSTTPVGAISGANYASVTSTGTSYNWAPPPNTNFYSSNNKTLMTIPHGEEKIVLEKAASLEVKGNVVINGLDLEERLKTIEKILQIPERDVIMESKYPKLADLYQQYMQELERYKTWERIKGDNDDIAT